VLRVNAILHSASSDALRELLVRVFDSGAIDQQMSRSRDMRAGSNFGQKKRCLAKRDT